MGSLSKYIKTFELGFQTALEYRLNFLISLISVAYPVFIQTFLWTAIYAASPQSVLYGYSYQAMLAYTFLAGLVTRSVGTGFEYDILDDIKNGKFSKFLVQPLNYFPYRLSSFLGQKTPQLAILLGLMGLVLAGLALVWQMPLNWVNGLAFPLTLALALLLNFAIFYGFSAVSFWIVEIGFLFEGIRIVIILLSGGIFPLEVFGPRVGVWLNLLPFKYTVSYPIRVLTGQVPAGEILPGLLMQCFWIGVCLGLARWSWQLGQRRYVAVGG